MPRLHLEYGGDLDHWLHMPIRWLRCYMTMYPRLRAEESLRRTQELFAGDSAIESDARTDVINGWRDQAGLPEASGKRHSGPVIDISRMNPEGQNAILNQLAPMLSQG